MFGITIDWIASFPAEPIPSDLMWTDADKGLLLELT